MNNKDIHSFPRQIADDHSINEAIVFKHLAYKTRRSKRFRDGKQWHYNSAKKLEKKLPYLSKSAIDAIVQRLAKANLLEIGNYNAWPHDKTRWFHVPPELWEAAEEGRIRFDSTVAAQCKSVPAAVLLFNLRHCLKKALKKSNTLDVLHTMSPKGLSDILPFSQTTVKEALQLLIDRGAILKPTQTKPEYTLPLDAMRDLKREAMLKK